MGKMKNMIDANAKKELQFKHRMHEENRALLKQEVNRANQVKDVLTRHLERDSREVHAMAKARDALVNAEMEKVEEARKFAETHRAEEMQAANAAIAGRIAGTNEALGDS